MALNSTPNASDIISFTQPLIKTNFDSINGGFNVDHVEFNTTAPYTGSNAGKHKQVTFIAGGTPASGANEFGLYNLAGDLRIVKVGGVDVPICGTTAATANMSYLPSGVIIKWGTGSVATGSDAAITFTPAFPNGAYAIFGALNIASSPSAAAICFSNFNTLGATAGVRGTGVESTQFWYCAIGH